LIHSKDRQEIREELDLRRRLVTSHEWVIWVKFLKNERKPKLQDKINSCVRANDFEGAKSHMAIFDDCTRQIELFSGSTKDLQALLDKDGE